MSFFRLQTPPCKKEFNLHSLVYEKGMGGGNVKHRQGSVVPIILDLSPPDGDWGISEFGKWRTGDVSPLQK